MLENILLISLVSICESVFTPMVANIVLALPLPPFPIVGGAKELNTIKKERIKGVEKVNTIIKKQKNSIRRDEKWKI